MTDDADRVGDSIISLADRKVHDFDINSWLAKKT